MPQRNRFRLASNSVYENNPAAFHEKIQHSGIEFADMPHLEQIIANVRGDVRAERAQIPEFFPWQHHYHGFQFLP